MSIDLKTIISGLKQRIIEVEQDIKEADYRYRLAKDMNFEIEKLINFKTKSSLMGRILELKDILKTLEIPEKEYLKLEDHKDSTCGLWATDRPEKIAKDVKDLFFEIKFD